MDIRPPTGELDAIDIKFCNAGAVLFGGADHVPAQMDFVTACDIGLNFGQTLLAVDGGKGIITLDFDMIHVVPPQKSHDFMRVSPLSNAAGWIDGTRPSRLAWYLKEAVLPPLYWEGMLKGREWMAQPEMVG